MRLFLYYASHSLLNTLKKMMKTWAVIFVIMIVFGGMIGLFGAMLDKSTDKADNTVTVLETAEDGNPGEEISAAEARDGFLKGLMAEHDLAKENIVGTMGILYGDWMGISAAFATKIAGFSFLVFNLLCAPCFAAIGAIKREMNNARWTWFAIGYQCGFAYAIALMINQFGNLFAGKLATGAGTVVNVISLVAAFAVLGLMIYMLFFRKYKEASKLTQKVKV